MCRGFFLTDRTEGCRKFLNFLFGGAGFEEGPLQLSDIITNRDIMESTIPQITDKHNEILQGKIDSDNAFPETTYYHDKITSDSMEQSFLDCLSTIETPYYAGDVSPEEVVEFLNDRVNKYVNEM